MSSSGFNEEQKKFDENTAKELNALLDEYGKHIDSKMKITKSENKPMPGSYLELNNEVKEDKESYKEKRRVIESIRESINSNNATIDRFAELLGRYQALLASATDLNPATNLGLKYTHGEKLLEKIKQALPGIENNKGFLVGKIKFILSKFLEERNQPTNNSLLDFNDDAPSAPSRKLTEDEVALYDTCRTKLAELYDTTKSYDVRIKNFEEKQEAFYALIKKVDPKNKGLFGKVSSAVSSTPETVLLDNLKVISNKYDEIVQRARI